jgi:hypothetical protein
MKLGSLKFAIEVSVVQVICVCGSVEMVGKRVCAYLLNGRPICVMSLVYM